MSQILMSQVSPMAKLFFQILLLFGLLGVLFWVSVIAYYFYAILFGIVVWFVKFIWSIMGIR